MKDYLDHEKLAGLPDNEVTDARKQRVLELGAGRDGGDGGWFSEAVDLRGDLKKAWGLWDKVSSICLKLGDCELIDSNRSMLEFRLVSSLAS